MANEAGGGKARVADAACVLVAAAGGLGLLITKLGAHGQGWIPGSAGTVFAVDAVIGTAASAALWYRRRWPAGVAVVLTVPLMLSRSAQLACLISVFSVSTRCRPKVVLAVAALHQVAFIAFAALWVNQYPIWVAWLLVLSYHVAIVAVGMYLRTRRELIASLHERVAQAERAQLLLAEQARRAERDRIAAEMHDVLAHRVSLLALHAGALEIRPDQEPSQVQATAALIRVTARQALTELRDVIGVLRDREAEPDAPHAPPPTLADIESLVAEFKAAGLNVTLDMRVKKPESAPGGLGRDTYRIVREGLTNVTKHASGTATTVEVSGQAGEGLHVVVRNRLPLGYADRALHGAGGLPGSGLGLTALAERVAMAGGTLSHGPDRDGDFVLAATLNWNGTR
ncbi:MAG TPA: histidine kinase [Trebonia sp.]|nr:histidine kinase [Trebonia sp.]